MILHFPELSRLFSLVRGALESAGLFCVHGAHITAPITDNLYYIHSERYVEKTLEDGGYEILCKDVGVHEVTLGEEIMGAGVK